MQQEEVNYIPVLIHTNPREVKESVSVLVQPGNYMVRSDHKGSVINLGLTSTEPYLNIKHGHRFAVTTVSSAKVYIVEPGTEEFISVSLQRIP